MVMLCLKGGPAYSHRVIDGFGGNAGTGVRAARWINAVLPNLTRPWDDTLHAFKYFKYPHRYFADVTWRFKRRFDLRVLVPRLLVAAARCEPWPELVPRDFKA